MKEPSCIDADCCNTGTSELKRYVYGNFWIVVTREFIVLD